MDGQRFDNLTRSLATGVSRRRVIAGLLGAVAAAAGLANVGAAPPACTAGAACQRTGDCCPAERCVDGHCKGVPGREDAHCRAAGCPTSADPCKTSVCNEQTGDCDLVADPAKEGAACPGADPCFQTYTCQAGTCVGSEPVDCSIPPDACHTNGSCNAADGSCDYPEVDCSNPPDACHTAGSCNSSNGACDYPEVECLNPPDACHTIGSCNPIDGSCDYPEIDCSNPPDACHTSGSCNPADGSCDYPEIVCGPNEVCSAGQCVCAGDLVRCGAECLACCPAGTTFPFDPESPSASHCCGLFAHCTNDICECACRPTGSPGFCPDKPEGCCSGRCDTNNLCACSGPGDFCNPTTQGGTPCCTGTCQLIDGSQYTGRCSS